MAHAQIPNLTDQKLVDSLFILLPKSEGTVKVDMLNQIALNLAPRSYDSSYQYASEALNLSEKLDYQKGKGIAIFNIGNGYYFTADYKSALLNYLKALRILENFEPHKELGNLLFMLGALNQYISNIEKMQDYYRQAVENYLAIDDNPTAMSVYLMLSLSYFHKLQILWQNDTLTARNVSNSMMDSAIKYSGIALDYYLQPFPKYKWQSKEVWLANIYNVQGQLYWNKIESSGKYDSLALQCFINALKKSGEIKDPKQRILLEGCSYSELGHFYYYYRSKYHEKCYEFAKNGEIRLKQTQRFDQYAFVLWVLGLIELDKDYYECSRKYFEKALNYCDTFNLRVYKTMTPNPFHRLTGVTNLQRIRTWIFSDMVNLYELKGDFQKALFYQKVLEDEKKKLSLDEQGRIIMGLQVIFEDELQNQQIEMTSKEKELAKLRLSRARLWFAGGGSVGVIVFLLIFLYFQRKKHSTEQNALLLKQRLLRSQMNPHFIFNSLSGIQNFIVTEKPTKASIYLSKFATLVRNILESSVKEYVTLEKEITTIENYLELQKIRYAGKFDFSLKTDDAIDPETTMIPPMLAQPFIENAIEHGIVHSDKMGQIDVEFRLENDVILFEVRDNGVGREKSKELEAHLEKDHQSMSTSITLERLAMLNKKRKHKIIFKITDLKDHDGNAAGTFVRFGIPL